MNFPVPSSPQHNSSPVDGGPSAQIGTPADSGGERLLAQQAFERWLNEPIEPCLILRRLPLVFQRVIISKNELTEAQLLSFACAFSTKYNFRLCFCPSNKRSYWVEPNAAVPPLPVETTEIFGNRPQGGLWLDTLRVNSIGFRTRGSSPPDTEQAKPERFPF